MKLFFISKSELLSWIPWNLSFRYILFHEKRLQTMLLHHNARVNSHQRWKQMRFLVSFHLWCELTSTMNVMEWQVSWNSWHALGIRREIYMCYWLHSEFLLTPFQISVVSGEGAESTENRTGQGRKAEEEKRTSWGEGGKRLKRESR